jgi:hypothetical protein
MSRVMPTTVLSHWNNMVEGLKQSSDEFYNEISKNLDVHHLKDIRVERVTLYEGGIFSAQREYLQVRGGENVYHVCAAPYGNGFFVSSWLGEVQTGFLAWLSSLPYIGVIVRLFMSFLKPLTYYRIDTAQMFHAVVHASVTGALNTVLNAQGKRELTESESKPVMRDLFARL